MHDGNCWIYNAGFDFELSPMKQNHRIIDLEGTLRPLGPTTVFCIFIDLFLYKRNEPIQDIMDQENSPKDLPHPESTAMKSSMGPKRNATQSLIWMSV